MHAGIHVKCSLLLSDLNQNWNVSTNFNKTATIKFHGNPFSRSGVAAFAHTDRHGKTSMRTFVSFGWENS
jgi:hypothetical protein